MGKVSKRILALIFAIVTCFSFMAVPASATPADAGKTFFEWVKGNYELLPDLWDSFWKEKQDDTAYSEYVSSLPATGYTSSGGLVVKVPLVRLGATVESGAYSYSTSSYDKTLYSKDYTNDVVSDFLAYGFDGSKFYATATNSKNNYLKLAYGDYSFDAPVSGYYSRPDMRLTVYYQTTSNATMQTLTKSCGAGSQSFYSAGSTVPFNPGWSLKDNYSYPISGSYFRFTLDPYMYVDVIPSGEVGNTYDNSTRTGAISGDYATVNGDVVQDCTIVNETNNTFYNPSTSSSEAITNWSYDYSDRSYSVTTDSGNYTVTYGDEYMSIDNGTTINNYYYYVDGSGSGGTEDPTTCEHDYVKTVVTAATCTVPGVQKCVCSKCGKVTQETIPALGHDWFVKQTVTTQYDESGNQTVAGYTIFECSRCGEQYKSTDGTSPPGGSGSGSDDSGDSGGGTIWDKLGHLFGSIADGVIAVIKAAIGKILDSLIELVDMINEKIGSVVESILVWFDNIPTLFGGFTAFLTAVFPFLPQELWDILLLGAALLVVVVIIKAIRNR